MYLEVMIAGVFLVISIILFAMLLISLCIYSLLKVIYFGDIYGDNE